MSATSLSSSLPSTRIRVGVICHGEELPSSFVESLDREVIEAVPIDNRRALPSAPDFEVLLLWLSHRTPARVLHDITSWVGARVSRVGIIGCSPHGDVEDSIVALEAGVDDFVAGRCGVRELASRIRSLRWRLTPAPAQLGCPGLRLDAPSHEVRRSERTIQLTSTEVSVMKALLSGGGRTLSRGAILDLAWGDEYFEVGERAVDNVILRLRRKLGPPAIIETVRGVGFRLKTEEP